MEPLKTYTLSQIADILRKPRSTVREWKDEFARYLPTIGSGRATRYKEEALEIFKLIADMKADGASREIIESVLRDTSTEIVIYEHEEPKNPVAELVRAYDEMAATMATMNEEWRKRFEQMTAELEAIREENARLREEIAAAREQTHAEIEPLARLIEERDEKLMQLLREIQESKKSFWKRLFGR